MSIGHKECEPAEEGRDPNVKRRKINGNESMLNPMDCVQLLSVSKQSTGDHTDRGVFEIIHFWCVVVTDWQLTGEDGEADEVDTNAPSLAHGCQRLSATSCLALNPGFVSAPPTLLVIRSIDHLHKTSNCPFRDHLYAKPPHADWWTSSPHPSKPPGVPI